MIANIPAVCPNGCGETTTRGELENHLQLCRERSYTCLRYGCQFNGPKQAFMDHISSKHWKLMLDNLSDWLPNQKTYHCSIAACRFQGKRDKVQTHIIETHERELASAMEHTTYISGTEQITLKNAKGVKALMANNGKFYCKKRDVINPYCIVEQCTAPNNNCVDCMKLDVLFRNLPYGTFVNYRGRVCWPKPCDHQRNRGDFQTMSSFVCRKSVCGVGPQYGCGDIIVRIDKKSNDRTYYTCDASDQCDACSWISDVMGRTEKDKGVYHTIWLNNDG